MYRDARLMIATAVITAPLVALWGVLGDHSKSCHYMGGAVPQDGQCQALDNAIPLTARDIFQLGFETGYNHGYDDAMSDPFACPTDDIVSDDIPMVVQVYTVQ